METAVLSKRIWLYIVNTIIYLGCGFALGLLFLKLLLVPLLAYIFISLGLAIAISFLMNLILLTATHGYNIGSAIFGVRYIAKDGEKLLFRQIIIRVGSESIFIFVVLDLIYFIKNRTERGIIDRISDSFAIDIRR